MTVSPIAGAAFALALGLVTVLLPGCVAGDGGYGDYAVGYYEPYGGDYGGWGPGYQVGPFRDGNHHEGGGGGRSAPHAYRSAPASHAMPSIPSGGRGRGGGPGHH